MKFVQKVNYSFIFALVVFALSMVASFIPCQRAPDLPNPEYSWKSCTLNPDYYQTIEGKTEFYGYTSSLAQTYILTLAIAFLIPFIILNVKLKKKD